MTWIIQVIDCHIGIIYKLRVYTRFRKVHLKRLKEGIIDNNNDIPTTAAPMTSKDKHILITEIIGDIHEEITESITYFRGFIATVT